jgi:SAM-dependent methyltransferase
MSVARLKQALFEVHHTQVYLPRNRRLAAGLARRIGRAESLLDVGCGDGATARAVAVAIGASTVRGLEVQLRKEQYVPVDAYDGLTLPFANRSFDAVTVCDVLHHAQDPGRLLSECVRVCRHCVVVKDHFSFGPLSHALLWAMDVAGNASAGVLVRGTYFSPGQWLEMVAASRARLCALDWPFVVHNLPWSVLAPPQLQFLARIEPT